MQFTNNPLKDKKGKLSSTRILVFLIILNALAMGWVTLFTSGHIGAIAIVTSISGVASGWKLLKDKDEKNE